MGPIANASVSLFLTQGFPETSMREIAVAAGMGKSSLYDYFPTKPEWTPCSGCLSSAKPASAEKGRLLLEVCVEGIARELRTAFDAAH